MERRAAEGRIRKRKADSDGSNERLFKVSRKLSLLNLDVNSHRESPPPPSPSKPAKSPPPPPESDVMQVDSTAHKVYIYNLDDELSDSDSSVDDNKLVFLPDIEKRLRQSRIPPSVLVNPDGELAGRNLRNELVLYNIPSSLTVPEGQDSVRKAIIESRARAREKQRREQERARTAPVALGLGPWASGYHTGQRPAFVRMDATNGIVPGVGSISYGAQGIETFNDSDAMDLS